MFIGAIHNFYPDYCLFGFASNGLQNPEIRKKILFFFLHKVGKVTILPCKPKGVTKKIFLFVSFSKKKPRITTNQTTLILKNTKKKIIKNEK